MSMPRALPLLLVTLISGCSKSETHQTESAHPTEEIAGKLRQEDYRKFGSNAPIDNEKSTVCKAFNSPQEHLGKVIEFDAFVVYQDAAIISPVAECGVIGLGKVASLQQMFSDPVFLKSRDLSTSEKRYAVQLTVAGMFKKGELKGLHNSEFLFEVTKYRNARLVVSERAYDWEEEPPR